MATAGLYRRLLPSPPAIDFSSAEGKQLFIEAINKGTMEGFYRLISYFQTQSEPAYCGLASLSVVLNALAIDPGRKWKGPWRWFDETMLDCCEPLEIVKEKGISFGKVVCLAHCAGAKVKALRTNQSTKEEFRNYVMRCSTSDDCHIITSYHRGMLKQTGTGHFSPIGGYHAEKDMVLILDVARFKYPPHWVSLTLLWEAMDSVDESTGKHRGFMLISRHHREPGILYTLSCKHESWCSISKYLMDTVPLLVNSENPSNIQKIVSLIFTSLPSNFGEFIKWVAEVQRQEGGSQTLLPEETGRLALKAEVLKQVQETDLYKHVSAFLSSVSSCCTDKSSSSKKDNLPEIIESICCQGAQILSGKCHSPNEYCCDQTCLIYANANSEEPFKLVSGTAVSGKFEQQFNVLVPCCGANNSVGMFPASNDVLTVLLLALPPETWSGIGNDKLLQEMQTLVFTENLPDLLREEILHLRGQFLLLKRCQENKVDEDLSLATL